MFKHAILITALLAGTAHAQELKRSGLVRYLQDKGIIDANEDYVSGGAAPTLAQVLASSGGTGYKTGGHHIEVTTGDSIAFGTNATPTANSIAFSAANTSGHLVGPSSAVLRIIAAKGIVLGSSLTTTATDGFVHVPTSAGPPTGVPNLTSGTAPIDIDATNDAFYFYTNGAWHAAGGSSTDLATVLAVAHVTGANGIEFTTGRGLTFGTGTTPVANGIKVGTGLSTSTNGFIVGPNDDTLLIVGGINGAFGLDVKIQGRGSSKGTGAYVDANGGGTDTLELSGGAVTGSNLSTGVNIYGGYSTGTGTGPIRFWVPAIGSTGSLSNSQSVVMTINSGGAVTMVGDLTVPALNTASSIDLKLNGTTRWTFDINGITSPLLDSYFGNATGGHVYFGAHAGVFSSNFLATGVNSSGKDTAPIAEISDTLGHGLTLAQTMTVSWCDLDELYNSTVDTKISKQAPGIVQFGTTSNNAAGSIACTQVIGGSTSVSAPTYAFLSHTNCGMYFDGLNNGVGISVGGNEFAYFAGSVFQTSANIDIISGNRFGCVGKMYVYNNTSTAGYGVPAIYASGRFLAQTGAKATIATFTPAADGSFEVSANVLVTTASSHAFTATCTYTDEGSTARTLTLTFGLVAGGVTTTSIANGNGAVPYHGLPVRIRAKGGTAITIQTTGTFTTVTYNVEAEIREVS